MPSSEIKPFTYSDDDAVDLSRLTFGSDDAERDAKHGFLDKVFLKTAVYKRILEGRRELVIGRKGSGKSAICLMLINALRLENITASLITPRYLSQNQISELRKVSINRDEAHILIWKHVLLTSIAKSLLSLHKSNPIRVNRQSIKNVKDALRSRGEIENNTLHKIISITKSISKISLKIFSIEGEVEAKHTTQIKDIAEEIEKFEDNISKSTTGLTNSRFLILIDRIDELWSRDEDSASMITGLIRAVHDLNSSLQNVNIILFLRSDIYDRLKFNDADKYRSLEERVNWTKRDLKHLITSRARFSAKLTDFNDDRIWNSIFESRILNKDSFDYVIERTMMRPRELIQFCNNALAIAQSSSHSKITKQDILSAEDQYSSWKLNDITSEFAIQYPFLEDLLGLFQGYKVSFTREEIEKRYDAIKDILENKHDDIKHLTINRLLQILYIIGFIGVGVNNNIESHKREVYVYDDPKLIAAQQDRMYIHPAFHQALGIASFDSIFRNRGASEINVAGEITRGEHVMLPITDIESEIEVNFGYITDICTNSYRQYIALYSDFMNNNTEKDIEIALNRAHESLKVFESTKLNHENIRLFTKNIDDASSKFMIIFNYLHESANMDKKHLDYAQKIAENLLTARHFLLRLHSNDI